MQVIAAGGPDAKAHTSMRLGGYAGLGIAASKFRRVCVKCLYLKIKTGCVLTPAAPCRPVQHVSDVAVLVAVIGVVSLSLCLFFGAVRGSMVLHAQLLKAVLRAPMSFFDTTPLVSDSNPPTAVQSSQVRYLNLNYYIITFIS